MPELPEVETVRRTLENFILNKKIEDIKILYPKIIDDDQEEFVQTLKNKTFKEIDRVGKYLIFKLEDVAFISHLRMEGKYQICKKGDILSKHDHVIFVLDEGMELRYNDVRKFGRMKLVDHDDYKNQLPLSKLGPEPFEIDYLELYQKLKKKNKNVQIVLLPIAPTGKRSTANVPKKSQRLKFNKAYSDLAAATDNVYYYDYTGLFDDGKGYLKSSCDGGDGCHWTSTATINFSKSLMDWSKNNL